MGEGPRSPGPTGLDGLRVLVTRPAHQNADLVAAIADAGAKAVPFPTIAIVAPADPVAAAALLARFEDFDLAIFVSANAVARAFGLLPDGFAIPTGVAVGAVGRATARALAGRGVPVAIVPSGGSSSEALLAHADLRAERIAGRRVLIVRGEGGRGLLADTLERRGARVEHAVVYRRVLPEVDEGALVACGLGGGIDAITATSGDAVRNLFELAGEAGKPWLREAYWVVVSARVASVLRGLGAVREPEVASGASEDDLVEALARWSSRRRRQGVASRDGSG
jgi:uroporphyrinogen-III synthase